MPKPEYSIEEVLIFQPWAQPCCYWGNGSVLPAHLGPRERLPVNDVAHDTAAASGVENGHPHLLAPGRALPVPRRGCLGSCCDYYISNDVSSDLAVKWACLSGVYTKVACWAS